MWVACVSAFLCILLARAQSENLKCSNVTTEVQAHPSFPSFGGICSFVGGKKKFVVKYCSFPKNNISITEDKVVQKSGYNYEYKCLFSEQAVFQQITGCVIENTVVRNGQIYETSNRRRYVCVKDKTEWYLDEIQKTEAVVCTDDQDARGVRFSCRKGKWEAIGCVDPLGSGGSVLEENGTLNIDGYYSFSCKKDPVWGFRLQVDGCLDFKKKVIPIGESVSRDNVQLSCEKSVDGQIIRHERLINISSGCSYLGVSYEEGEELYDSGNLTVYRCTKGQIEKIACIVKENRVSVDRIFYCFDHPYYCTRSGTGVALLQNNGCFNNGTLVKATRKIEKQGATFICSRGPFEPVTQSYMFTQTLSACTSKGVYVNLHQYAKIDGKWMYCDESRNPNAYSELRELTHTETMCADKYGEQMSSYCVIPQNKEVNPEIATQLNVKSFNFSNVHPETKTERKFVKSDFSGSSDPRMLTTLYPEEKKLASASGLNFLDQNSSTVQRMEPTTVDAKNSKKELNSKAALPQNNSSGIFNYSPNIRTPGYNNEIVTETDGRALVPDEIKSSYHEEEKTEKANRIVAQLQQLGYRCETAMSGESYRELWAEIEPSKLTEEEKKQKYSDSLDSNMCKMLSGYCLDWIKAEAIFHLSPDQIMMKPLFQALSSDNLISVLQAVEKIGKSNQFKQLNEQSYHIRRIFNFTLFRLSAPETQCRLSITQCFKGVSEGCEQFLKTNCLMDVLCPLTGNFDSINSLPLLALKPFVRHLCPYTCAQWLSNAGNELAVMKSVISLAQYSEKCMIR